MSNFWLVVLAIALVVLGFLILRRAIKFICGDKKPKSFLLHTKLSDGRELGYLNVNRTRFAIFNPNHTFFGIFTVAKLEEAAAGALIKDSGKEWEAWTVDGPQSSGQWFIRH